MNKLTKLALVVATASALFLTSCGEEKTTTASKEADAAASITKASEGLSNVANDDFADKVDLARQNTEAYKKESETLTPENADLAAPEKQFISYNQMEMPYTIDPTQISSSEDAFAAQELFDPLVRLHRSGEIVPVAAESWETSEDGLTWTFHLRKDATWTDGKPVTSKDFLYSFRRLADPATGAVYSFFYQEMGLKNADDVIEGKKPVEELGVEAPDDYTFVLHLDRPLPWLLQTLTIVNLSPLRQDVIEKFGKEWTKPENIVNNGPYKLTKYVLNDIMEYSKRDDYWGAKDIVINTIKFDFIKNAKVGYYNYLKNLYPTAAIPNDLKKQVLEDRPGELIYIYRPSIASFKINNENVPDVRVRKALSLLINRQFLVNKIAGSGEATTKLGPNTVSEGEKITEQDYLNRPYSENVEEARKLLAEAGYTQDKPFVLNFLSGSSDYAKKFVVASKGFFESGSNGLIKFVPEFLDGKTSYDRVQSGKYDVTTGGWGADYDQVSNFYNLYRCGGSQNDIKYCNPKFDALLDKASVETDPAVRADLYRQANDIIVGEDAAILPYSQTRQFLIKNPDLKGYAPWLMTRYVRDWFFVKGNGVAPAK